MVTATLSSLRTRLTTAKMPTRPTARASRFVQIHMLPLARVLKRIFDRSQVPPPPPSVAATNHHTVTCPCIFGFRKTENSWTLTVTATATLLPPVNHLPVPLPDAGLGTSMGPHVRLVACRTHGRFSGIREQPHITWTRAPQGTIHPLAVRYGSKSWGDHSAKLRRMRRKRIKVAVTGGPKVTASVTAPIFHIGSFRRGNDSVVGVFRWMCGLHANSQWSM